MEKKPPSPIPIVKASDEFYTQASLFSSFNSTSKKRFNFNSKIVQNFNSFSLQPSFSNMDSTTLSSFDNLSFNSEDDLSEKKIKLKISNALSYHEDQPVHKRKVLSETIDELLLANKELGSMKITELTEDSWFSILWTPLKSTLSASNKQNASFLVFYKFVAEEKPFLCLGDKIKALKVTGVIANGLEDDYFWFSNNMPIFNISSLSDSQIFSKLSEDFYNNKCLYTANLVNF